MNKITKKQLDKCRTNLPPYDESTTHMVIPCKNRSDIVLKTGGRYLILLEDYLIHPYPNFMLHDNWNGGIIPTDNTISATIIEMMGKMIKVDSTGVNDNSHWVGWLPVKSIHVQREIKNESVSNNV